MLTDHAARRLAWDACNNVRDLGGYPTAGGGFTRMGAIVRSDDLCNLSQEGQAALIEYGIRTVIDLRGPWESPMDTSPFGRSDGLVRYLNLPVIDLEDFAGSAVEQSGTTEESYRVILDEYRPQIVAVMAAIADAPDGSVLIHCHAGKDRTGLISALLLGLAGVSDEIIVEDYALSDTYLQPLYRKWAEEHPEAGVEISEQMSMYMQCPPEAMVGTLAYLRDRYGGMEAYLIGGGLDAGAIQRIRHRLCA